MELRTITGNSFSTNFTNTPIAKNQSINYANELKSDTISFTGKKKEDIDVVKPKKSGIMHKSAVALTSAFLPGLGQAINGQWGKALLCYAGFDVTSLGVFLVTGNPVLASLIAVGGRAFTFIDAYRNA